LPQAPLCLLEWFMPQDSANLTHDIVIVWVHTGIAVGESFQCKTDKVLKLRLQELKLQCSRVAFLSTPSVFFALPKVRAYLLRIHHAAGALCKQLTAIRQPDLLSGKSTSESQQVIGL
jgi:hypothetical protein